MARIIAAASVLLFLAGCGGGAGLGSLNPFNWFRSGGDEVETLVAPRQIDRRDTRPLAEEITDIAVERVPGGAILRVRARVAATGWHGADLAADPARSGEGVLTFTFRARPPEAPVPQAGPASRRLVAAVFLSEGDLAGVRQLRVVSRGNIRSARR